MRRMGWNDIGHKEAAAVIACRQGQSRGDPRRPQRRKAMSFVCSIPLIASLFSGLRRTGAARRRLCRGRIRAARADRGGQVETVSVRRGDRVKAGERDRHTGKRRRDDRGGTGRGSTGPGRGAARRSAGRQAARGDRRARGDARLGARRRRRRPERVFDAAHRSPQARHRAHRPISTRPRPQLDVATAMVGQARPIWPSPGCRRGRDDQGRGEPGQAGAGRARPGAVAAVQAHHRGAFGRPHRRHHPQPRRSRRSVGAGDVDAARRRGQAQALSAGGELLLGEGRQPARRALRRLQARAGRRASATSRPTRNSRRR